MGISVIFQKDTQRRNQLRAMFLIIRCDWFDKALAHLICLILKAHFSKLLKKINRVIEDHFILAVMFPPDNSSFKSLKISVRMETDKFGFP